MYTSVIKKRALKTAIVYVCVAAFCALFGTIYESYSHGVFSFYMAYCFLPPLVLGAVPFFAILLFPKAMPGRLAFNLYNSGIATLTAGFIFRGVIEIFGTTNSLSRVYSILSALFLSSGVIFWIISVVKGGKKIAAGGDYRDISSGKKTDYGTLTQQLVSITDNVKYFSANTANAAAVIYNGLDKINWAGFYFMENGKLVLGAFQGKPACIEIEVGRGVCGAAAEKNETQLVPDVTQFPGYIACDPKSRSEIVIPIHKNGEVFGVLDIDSPYTNRFSEDDAEGLSRFVSELEKII